MYRCSILIFLLFSSLVLNAGSGTIDFTPHGTQPGLAYSMGGSNNCSGCHKGGSVTDDPINMPYSTWVGSMKANATRDPLFWAALDVANNDLPGVGDFCLKCHSPLGWYNGRVAKPVTPGDPPVDGVNGCELAADYTDVHSQHNDFDGVTCEFCHRMDQTGPGGEAQIIQNGSVWIDDEACPTDSIPCRKGPYSAEDYNDGGSTPFHGWEYSSFIQSAEFCGSCHNVSSPDYEQNGVVQPFKTLVLSDGTATSLAMPVERTYSEWQNSYFADLIYRDGMGDISSDLPALVTGANCQTCHMPQSESIEARACVFDNLNGMGEGRRMGNLPTHQFAGGNSWIPQVLKGLYGADLEASDTGRLTAFDLTTSYALDMLQNQSALLDASVNSVTSEELSLAITVTNLTGHKLPTGYPEGRRMWLQVVVRDASNAIIWESGAYDEMTGVLTEDAQVKVYESLQGIWNPAANGGDGACEITDGDGDKMFHFALNDCVAKDNRIPPLGFRSATDPEMMPVGITYPARPGHPGEVVNYDVTNYLVPVSGQTGPFSVEATLKYQIASKEYIDFLDKEATNYAFPTENQMCDRTWTEGPADQSRGAFMKSLWQNYGRSAPVDMVMDFIGGINP